MKQCDDHLSEDRVAFHQRISTPIHLRFGAYLQFYDLEKRPFDKTTHSDPLWRAMNAIVSHRKLQPNQENAETQQRATKKVIGVSLQPVVLKSDNGVNTFRAMRRVICLFSTTS